MAILMILLLATQKCLYLDFSVIILPVGFPEAEQTRVRRKEIAIPSQALVSMEEDWFGTWNLDLRIKMDLYTLQNWGEVNLKSTHSNQENYCCFYSLTSIVSQILSPTFLHLHHHNFCTQIIVSQIKNILCTLEALYNHVLRR